ncbi:hypothetical protein FG379_002844 [Cryptosporidium bovis]|uniref:uncharacterized protein n=1 Tax=Cryptosporidium bovis TaxID=310047 RepID=UPI00351AA01B|nr:hypothetical protein FG379_002844 [Cryptosporidium bovis]
MKLSVKSSIISIFFIIIYISGTYGIEFNLHRALEEQRKLVVNNPFFALGSDIKQLRKLAITQPEAIKNAGVIVAHVDNPTTIKPGAGGLDNLLSEAEEMVKTYMDPKKQNLLLNIISPYDRIIYDDKQALVIQDSIEKHKQLLRAVKDKMKEEKDDEKESDDEE